MSEKNKITLGKEGEEAACNYLLKKGYRIITRNYRYSRTEIDIIAVKEKIICFVEVKTRTNSKFGTPEESITSQKLINITSAAEMFLQENDYSGFDCQIDAITVFKTDRNLHIEHYENVTA